MKPFLEKIHKPAGRLLEHVEPSAARTGSRSNGTIIRSSS